MCWHWVGQIKIFIMCHTFSFAPSLSVTQPGMSYWTVESALCWLLLSGQGGIHALHDSLGRKKQCRLIARLTKRQTVQSTAPGSQCYVQNWVSLSWISCSREHSQGEVSECFSQATLLPGNTDFHFNIFEEVDNGFKINEFIHNEHKMLNVLCTSKCLCETVSIKKNMLYISGWITVLLHVIIHKK